MKLITVEDIKTKYTVGGTVTDPSGYDDKTKIPSPNGLFSYQIFGRTLAERKQRFGVIELPVRVLHPVFLLALFQKKRKLCQHIIEDNKPFVILSKDELAKTGDKYKLFDTVQEALEFAKDRSRVLFSFSVFVDTPELLLTVAENTETDDYIKKVLSTYERSLAVTQVPVIPPIFRNDSPETWSSHVLNRMYINILRLCSLLVKTTADPSNEKWSRLYNALCLHLKSLTETVIELVKGKGGTIRSYVYGKREDFSGRAVISPNPSLSVDELGVPIRMLARLFEPYIVRRLVKEKNLSVSEALSILDKIYYSNTKQIYQDEKYKEYIDIIINETKGKIVLTKRDPSIHRLSICAFKVVPVFDNTIHLHPFNTVPFNADFDGDTMAVFSVLTTEAYEDAKKLLNPYHSASPVKLKFVLNKDYKKTFRLATLRPSEELRQNETNAFVKDIWTPTKLMGATVTKGVAKIWSLLPEEIRTNKKLFELCVVKPLEKSDYIDDDEFIYTLLNNSKIELSQLIDFYNNLSKYLSEITHHFSETITIVELLLSEDINTKLKKRLTALEEKYGKDTPEYLKQADVVYKEISREVLEQLKKNSSISKSLHSNIVKTTQLLQIIVGKGIIQDWKQNFVVVKDALGVGLNEDSLFLSGQSARSGIAYRVIMTSIPGVIERKLCMALSPVTLGEDKDCGTKRTVLIRKVQADLLKQLIGRYIVQDGKLTLLTPENLSLFVGKDILLRSPIYCKTPRICRTCYGELHNLWKTREIGLLAATSIGERLYQEMLKVFHAGGAVDVSFINVREYLIKELGQDPSIVDYFIEFDEKTHVTKTKQKDILLQFSRELYSDLFRAIKIGEHTERVFVVNNFCCVLQKDDKELVIVVPGSSEIEFLRNCLLVSYDEDNCVVKLLDTTPLVTVKPSKGGIDMSVAIWKLLTEYADKLNIVDVDVLLLTLYNAMKKLGHIALVHYEVMLSHTLRNKHDKTKLARLHEPYEPVLVSLTTSMRNDSPLLKGAFMHFKNEIISGIIQPVSTISQYDLDSVYLRGLR